MKAQILLPVSIAISVASFALMKIRIPEIVSHEKRISILDVKLRVSEGMVAEYEKEKQSTESRMQMEKTAQEQLQKELTELSTASNTKKTELDACMGQKKTVTDEIASAQEQLKTFQDQSAKEKTAWEAEIAALKENLNTQSPICNYLKPGSSVQGCPEKKEEPKPNAEQPKPEPPKAEEAKPDAPKPDAPKPEEPKADAPKPEEPKADAPKPEEPKQEAQNPEAVKPEAPKQ
ncbi:hypothetical protein NL108_018413 [Boleophthalmus pectinirostris]|uniref:30S ribosomal protein S16-like isoform X1 n=1 Tax=Boleophthalmus pectinirostris TaxID=150288 RepID=UPI000A1C5587|nr:30S ribosomal protein S16-like isoform X1 [Boleophthalmus pectinirostris]KAJ0037238.1 hypothetical protein NL108_018413 [Boleophthalmus pectinirostris]